MPIGYRRHIKTSLVAILLVAVMLPFQNCGNGFVTRTQSSSVSSHELKACTDSSKLLGPQLKRLTVDQFANSVTNAFGDIFNQNQFPELGDSNPRIGLAADPDHLTIDEVNIDPLHNSVGSLVNTIKNSNSMVSSCISGSGSACYENVINSMGLKLWRRPLTTDEVKNIQTGITAINNAGGNRQQRMDFVLKVLLMAPEHLYRTEIGSSSTPATKTFSLTQYEIASLLSFSVWDSPPDETLLKAAENNALRTKEQLRAQLKRMTAHPLFTKKMASFALDVLKIESVKSVPKGASVSLTNAERRALFTSAKNSIEDAYSNENSSLMAPFTQMRFHTNDVTARFFGIPTAGLSSSFTSFNANPNERFGMLSHPAFLTSISGEVSSGIVRRGVYTLEQLLCQHLGTPPADIPTNPDLPPGWDPTKVTSREELHVTHSSQTGCIGCHRRIDPAGYGFENFNNLGQFRTVEKGNIPIDASGSLSIVSTNSLNFRDSVDFLQVLAGSDTLRQCMEKRFFKYVSGETHETSGGKCEFQNFEYQIAKKNESIQSLLESFIELESFTKRNPASD